MALVTVQCMWISPGFSLWITFDDVTELVDSLTAQNDSDRPFELNFRVGRRTGTRTIAAHTSATQMAAPGKPQASDIVAIWAG